jgi:hypothetical protein
VTIATLSLRLNSSFVILIPVHVHLRESGCPWPLPMHIVTTPSLALPRSGH